MKVVALFRVSTEKQGTDGASLDAQERIYRELAVKQGWTTVAEFRGCESATQAATERRVLQQVLACIREQQPEAIYVHEQSRLTRGDELEAAMLMRELREQKIKIIVGGVVRDLASIDERFMVGIQSLVDRAESERIKERMRRGRDQKARQGKKNCGAAPFGYRNPGPGEAGRGTLQPIEAEAVVVRHIFDLAARGKGAPGIAADLNAKGMVASRGGSWGKTSVKRVLQNPAYIGTLASGVWHAAKGSRNFRFNLQSERAIIVENAHPPIVDRDVWNQVNGRARTPRTATPRMLSGLLFVDGRRYEGDSSRTQRFYRSPKGVKGCAWLDMGHTDDAVWAAFASLATSEEFVESLMAEAGRPQERLVVLQQIDHLAEQVAKLRRRHDRLVDMRSDGEITKAEYLAKAEATTKAMGEMDAELGKLRAQASALDGTQSARIVKAVQVVLAGRTRLTCDQKRSILRSIVRRIEVTSVSTGAKFERDDGGRILKGSNARWRVGRVSFTLALPPKSGAEVPREPGFRADAPRANDGEPVGPRAGQLGTTPFSSALPAPARR